MQNRNKVGGLVDRRFGESDPTMSLEDKMMERFAREQLRSHKKSNVFDLEDDNEPMEGLTHGGKAISFDVDAMKDDFAEEGLGSSDDDEDDGMHPDRKKLKRMRFTETGDNFLVYFLFGLLTVRLVVGYFFASLSKTHTNDKPPRRTTRI